MKTGIQFSLKFENALRTLSPEQLSAFAESGTDVSTYTGSRGIAESESRFHMEGKFAIWGYAPGTDGSTITIYYFEGKEKQALLRISQISALQK